MSPRLSYVNKINPKHTKYLRSPPAGRFPVCVLDGTIALHRQPKALIRRSSTNPPPRPWLLTVICRNPRYFELEAAGSRSKTNLQAPLDTRTSSIMRREDVVAPARAPWVLVRLGRQYACQMGIHFQVVCAGNPSDVDAEQGPQLAQRAVELSLIGRPIS